MSLVMTPETLGFLYRCQDLSKDKIKSTSQVPKGVRLTPFGTCLDLTLLLQYPRSRCPPVLVNIFLRYFSFENRIKATVVTMRYIFSVWPLWPMMLRAPGTGLSVLISLLILSMLQGQSKQNIFRINEWLLKSNCNIYLDVVSISIREWFKFPFSCFAHWTPGHSCNECLSGPLFSWKLSLQFTFSKHSRS